MILTFHTVLLLLALIAFLGAAFVTTPRVNLQALGLALLAASLLFA